MPHPHRTLQLEFLRRKLESIQSKPSAGGAVKAAAPAAQGLSAEQKAFLERKAREVGEHLGGRHFI